MSVYVDQAFISATVHNGSAVHTSKWCHLMADSTDELVEFGKRIGLKESWLQSRGKVTEHFDVTQPKRRAAVAAGAIEIDSEKAVDLLRLKSDARKTVSS